MLNGPWDQTGRALKVLATPGIYKAAYKKAATKEAHRLRGLMIDAFKKGGPAGQRWPRLSVFTQLVSRAKGKGDRRPLTDNADLRNSIAVHEENDVIFVGTHRKAKAKKSKKHKSGMINIALVHNYGTRLYTIKVSEKMRKYFRWLFVATKGQIKPLKASTTHISMRIPARPWVEPVWDRESRQSAQNITNDMIKLLSFSGLLGGAR